jgi:nitrite reductase (NO-forming)
VDVTRDAWHLRANIPVFAYLLAAVLLVLASPVVPHPYWQLTHLLLLGAATNAIVVWSSHFAQTLLRLPADTGRRALVVRLAVLNVGVVLVLGGAVGESAATMTAGAVLVAGAALAHIWALARMMRRGLPARFRPLIRYYVAAAAFLPVGAALGAELSTEHDDPVQARMALAHIAANVLGWVGLTVAGTLVTLWPTILRMRMADGVERAAARALPVLIVAVAVIVGGALLGAPAIVVAGLVGYLAGWALLAWPHVRGWRRPTSEFASTFSAGSVLAAVCWLAVGLVWAAVIVATSADWGVVDERLGTLAVPFAVGFGAQILLGALTYLIPSVLGGGPEAVRQTVAALEAAARTRLGVANAGLVLLVAAGTGAVALAGGVLALVSMAAFLPVAAVAIGRNRRFRRVPLSERRTTE